MILAHYIPGSADAIATIHCCPDHQWDAMADKAMLMLRMIVGDLTVRYVVRMGERERVGYF